MIFGERLKKARIDKGSSQKELADALHLKVNAISNYERGKRQPDIRTITEIAKVLDISIDYLTGYSDVNIKPSLMHTQYVKGISVERFIDKAMRLDASHRQAIMTILKYAEKDQYICNGGNDS